MNTREDGLQRGRDGIHQAAVIGCTADVDGQHAVMGQVRVDFLKELARRQVPRDVGHFVGIERDDIVTAVQLVQLVTAVAHNHVDVGFVQREVVTTGLHDGGIELDTVDRNRAIDLRELLGNGAGGQSDHGRAPRRIRGGIDERCGQHDAPDRHAGHASAVTVERVEGLAFVEQQIVAVVAPDDLHVVVGRFGFVDLAGIGFERALGPKPDKRQQQERGGGAGQRAAAVGLPEADEPDKQQDQTKDDGRDARTGQWNHKQHWYVGAQQAAPGGNGVDAPADAPGFGHVAHGQADRKGRDHAQQRDRHGERDDDAHERAENGAGVDGRHGGCGAAQNDAGQQQEEDAAGAGEADEAIEGLG